MDGSRVTSTFLCPRHSTVKHFPSALGLDLPGSGGEMTVAHGTLRSFDIYHLDIKFLYLEVLHDGQRTGTTVRCQDI